MMMTLDDLRMKTGIIKRLVIEGSFKERLEDMGFVEGSKIRIIREAPLGDPIEIIIKGYKISIRKKDAKKIIVEVPE